MKRFITVVELLLVFVMLGCAAVVGFYFYESYTSKAEVKEIKEQVVAQSDNAQEKAENGMLLKYYNLYLQNNDMVGWIKVPGTPIDYPVLQTDNNDFYMHHNFYKEYKYSGLPFMDFQCNFKSDNIIIYAHNMKDGTMFAGLLDYDKKEFYEQNKTINFDTLYEEGEYQIAAVFHAVPTDFSYHSIISLDSKDEFDNFIKEVKSRMIYDTGINLEYGDRLLTLSTCSYNKSNERLVVIAKRI